MTSRRPRSTAPPRIAAVLAALALLAAATACAPQSSSPAQDAADRIAALFDSGVSGVEVEGAGRVERRLPDDDDGSRHQRWIVRLQDGRTLLISHNVDIAPRVPAATGDRLEFRGVYEWNARGGVVHWTHRDPGGRRAGGWVRHRGRTYR